MNSHSPDLQYSNQPTWTCDELDSLMHALDDELDALPAANPPRSLLSFVIPTRDEQQTVRTLCERIRAHVPDEFDHEIILIDDGSRDGSWQAMAELARQEPHTIRGIKMRHNVGKAIALSAGFRAAKGDIVFTLDADLQDDPREIPRFLSKLDEGFDLVSGWKRIRHDPWHKVLPSRVFNRITSFLGGVRLHDHNCGFKCYRADVTRGLFLYGEMHRMIPSLAGMQGFRCAEIEVQHHPRQTGHSKYGWERFLRGLSDAITVGFMRRFKQRPAHFFNSLAAACGTVALVACLVINCRPVSHVGLSPWILIIVCLQLAVTAMLHGLLAEMVIRGPLRVAGELPVELDTGCAARAPGAAAAVAGEHLRPDTGPETAAATVPRVRPEQEGRITDFVNHRTAPQ